VWHTNAFLLPDTRVDTHTLLTLGEGRNGRWEHVRTMH
jgi:hypothetical protein